MLVGACKGMHFPSPISPASTVEAVVDALTGAVLVVLAVVMEEVEGEGEAPTSSSPLMGKSSERAVEGIPGIDDATADADVGADVEAGAALSAGLASALTEADCEADACCATPGFIMYAPWPGG